MAIAYDLGTAHLLSARGADGAHPAAGRVAEAATPRRPAPSGGDASPGAGAWVASAGSGATEDAKAAEDLQKRLEARFQRAQTKRQVRTSIAPPATP